MRTLYNIVFRVFLLLAWPFHLWRARRLPDLGQRLGQYDRKLKQALTNRQVLWLHVPQPEQVNLCTQLIRVLEPRLPNVKLVVSAGSDTAMEALQSKLPSHVSKIYFPFDRRAYVSRALSLTNPEAVVLLAAEVWPNFVWRAHARGTPVFLVSSHLSERAWRLYRRLGLLFRPLFASLAGVAVPTEAEAVRLRKLGCRADRIEVVGSLQFDAARLEERRRLDVSAMLGQLGVQPAAPVFLAAGTAAGEEELLADQFLRLRLQFSDLFLILIPQHIERSREIGAELGKRGLHFVYRNEVLGHTHFEAGAIQCLLVNTPGERPFFYEEAALVFLGRSLRTPGGQDPIGPGAAGKPIVFGPHMEEFAGLARSFVEHQGALQVRDAEELGARLAELLADGPRRERMGRNALQVVRQHLGGVDRTTELILKHLDQEDLFVTPRK